ncbi:MAG: FkbM family methyltransferase, partial [Chitinophagaceae bacterium]|nr:FkbM family methyltransferase [Chitinophagaceae bacterium]
YNGRYCRAIEMLQKKYDVVIVDGRDRNQCLEQGIQSLKPGGVVILDNSERSKYQKGVLFMKEQGFKHLEFEGMSPVTTILNVTSLFYKEGNCLGV